MTRRCVPTGNALTLAIRTRVPVNSRFVFPLATVTSARVRQIAAQADTRVVEILHLTAKLPQRKNAKPTTIVRRTKNAPTAIASTANKILPCEKSGLSAAFFYILFRVRFPSLVIARPRQRQNNPLTPPLRPVSCK